ncbi:hypothetical protein DFQ28_000239 [Apophysomyces sp. BC1034]|nr:hypothetical protein DFQ29_009662 [Apophysomyces sp. BC1021]KAG0191416.1 hypothetical protein DFQ28_000239 [Apophysomyces sp. BC1034]
MDESDNKNSSSPSKTDIDIPPEWIRGIHVDRTQAKKQAVEIDSNANIYLFPKSVLKLSTENIWPTSNTETQFGDIDMYEPNKLPLPGSREFRVAAEAAVKAGITKSIVEAPEEAEEYDPLQEKDYQLRIPRKHIVLPPAALRATKEFKDAIHYALQQPTDNEKLVELQYVFKEFGYYYPYWIIAGGRFLYSTSEIPYGTPREIIERALTKKTLLMSYKKKPQWEAFGGDVNLLYGGRDIDGWIESTATRPDLIMPFDVNPIYSLLEDGISSEVQRIYKTQYHHLTSQVNPLTDMESITENTLIRLSQARGKVGVTKGVHFGGSLSEEDAVELVNETDITKLMRLVSVAGKPRVQCMVRRTILGTSINTHAFLPDDLSDRSVEDSGFTRAATTYHIESNGGEIQSSTRELVFDTKYTKGTDNFKQSVSKALGMKSDNEKFQELQKVFGRFGYYYPSSISLGGRMVYKAYPRGSSLVTGCQDWIDSIQTNQTRTQFGTLRPIYELLEDEQRVQVLRLYDESHGDIDGFPEIPKGLHFDGTEAKDHVIGFTKDKTHSKMIMLRNFFDQPTVDHVKRYPKGVKDIESHLSLDIDTKHELPGSVGFISGSEGAYKELSVAHKHHYPKTETVYDVAYVTYKELYLYDEFIQPTNQFKEAINKALLVGNEDQDTYYALQDIFQRFGYYYPSSIQFGIIIGTEYTFNCLSHILGGRLALNVPPHGPEDKHPIQDKDLEIFFDKTSETSSDSEPKIVEIPQLEVDNQDDPQLETDNQENPKLESGTAIYCAFKGGDSVALLLNDVKGWLSTIESNQTITQRRGLKPVYELLDEEQRHKIQQTYENIILGDKRVRYNYLLEMKNYNKKLEDDQKNAPETVSIPTGPLFQQLLTQVFPDKNTAVRFCRSACADYGFSVIEEEVTDQIVCIYCSRGALSGFTLHNLQDEQEHKGLCQWGVMLFKNDAAEWRFQKFANEDESMHNHSEPIQETQTYQEDIYETSASALTSKIIIKPVAGSSVYDQGATDSQYVRYGDIVRLWMLRERNGGDFIFAGDDNIAIGGLPKDERLAVRNELKNLEDSFLWKVVRCPLPGDEDDNKTDDKEEVIASYDYVRNNDYVMFESQLSLKGNIRVCVYFKDNIFQVKALNGLTGALYKTIGSYIEPMNQYMFLKDRKTSTSDEYKHKKRIASMLESSRKETPDDQLELGRYHMYGACGLDINNIEALKYLQLATSQGSREAFYELGNLYWRIGEYQKALDMFEEAALLSQTMMYCKLGNIYHTGFSASHVANSFTAPKDQKTAFMCYSIGGIFGDATAALKIGECYEKGRNEDFGVDHNKALQWYEYISIKSGIPEATSAVGRIKHALANATRNPLEAEDLRQEAYSVFKKVTLVDPYAKFMVAMYNLNGWGSRQPDPALGFDMLLSLVETGVNMALHGIAKCYEQGVGVEHDPAKALAYQELATRMNAQ